MKVYSVGEAAKLIAKAFRRTYFLNNIAIRGTIVNLKEHFSGNIYFNLLDKDGRIFSKIEAARHSFLKRDIYNGCEATVIGDLIYNIYQGTPNLIVSRIIDVGESGITRNKEALYRELLQKGWFDPLKKKALPPYPSHIGVITSSSGAVIHDILTTGRMRNDSIRYTLWGTSVQGETAAKEMALSLNLADNSEDKPDILILARGGGSEDDLSPFNEKILLEAVHNCSIPVISAVGHETDVTMADLTADVRASTPTQAAEIAIPSKAQLIMQIDLVMARMADILNSRIGDYRNDVHYRLIHMKDISKSAPLARYRMDINKAVSHMDSLAKSRILNEYKKIAEISVSMNETYIKEGFRNEKS